MNWQPFMNNVYKCENFGKLGQPAKQLCSTRILFVGWPRLVCCEVQDICATKTLSRVKVASTGLFIDETHKTLHFEAVITE